MKLAQTFILLTLAFSCTQVCEDRERNFLSQDIECFKRCENKEVVCYVKEMGLGGALSCFKRKLI